MKEKILQKIKEWETKARQTYEKCIGADLSKIEDEELRKEIELIMAKEAQYWFGFLNACLVLEEIIKKVDEQ